MVSVQVILLLIGVIGFFATGGVGKTRLALTTARQDFEMVKQQTTDFVTDIKAKSRAGAGGQEG